MNELVFLGQDGRLVTTSLKVAEVFGKVHAKVMRDIEKLDCSNEFTIANFGKRTFKTEQGNEYPMYEITKDGFVFLVMGYTGKKAAEFKEAYIKKFNEMEAELKSQQTKQLSAAESLLQSVKLLVAHERQLAILEHNQKNMQGAINTLYDEVYGMKFQTDLMRQKLNNEIERYTVIGYCSLHKIDITRKEAAIIGGACARMCKKENITTESIADPRFGKVNTYPSEIIAKCYENRQKKLLEQTIHISK